jgi:hypothetical protein
LDAAKLEVRADNGDLIASNYFTGMVNAVCGHETIAMWYDNDRVEIRNLKLDLLTSNYYTGIVGLAIIAKTIVNKNQKIEPLIILYYKDRKVETRDKQLNLISTRYR